MLVVPYDHERIELSRAKDFAHVIDPGLASTDAIAQNVEGDLTRHIRAGLRNQFVEAARPTILVEKTSFGTVNLGVASEVLCRAVQQRAVRRSKSKDNFGYFAPWEYQKFCV